jgi:anaerobic magnesium-protoporphyrin IX monomethyl ester cyclase
LRVGLIPSINLFIPTEIAAYTARQYFPLGLLYLVPLLERAGHEVFLYDVSGMMQREGLQLDDGLYRRIVQEAIDDRVEILGFSTMPNTYSASIRMAELFKERSPGSAVVFGGSQATICDRETLEAFDDVDAVVRGEAETIIVDLIDAIGGARELTTIPNVSCRAGGGIFRHPERTYVESLDELPLPAYDRITPLDHAVEYPIETHRGCPYRCTYCCIHKISPPRVRFKSNERIIREITHSVTAFKSHNVGFISDHFLCIRDKVRELCESMIANGVAVRWGCDSRVDSMDESMIRLIKQAGCSAPSGRTWFCRRPKK